MDYQQHVNQIKVFQDLFLTFLDNEDDFSQDYENIIKYFSTKINLKNRLDLHEILQLISQIAQNHHRLPDFYTRLEKILFYLKNSIKQTFSNFDIYNIFKNNKLILLILLDTEILTIDESNLSNFCFYYFSPEIEKFLDNETKKMLKDELSQIDQNITTDFNKKRQLGSNPSYVCELIRNDSIDDFIVYVNQSNISLASTVILHSIFETNEFLLDKNPTFIEYAAFYGSIQIFQYLRLNNVPLDSSLWLYVIHSKNAELIHLLEENHVEPPDNLYENCLKEAVKCHHNDIAKYIIDVFLSNNINFSPFCYYYYNYDLFPEKIYYEYLFQNDYAKLVDILIKMKGNDINNLINIYIYSFFF